MHRLHLFIPLPETPNPYPHQGNQLRYSACLKHSLQDHQVTLYKFVFPLNDPSLAVIGLIQPIGSVAPISEMQSRWAASVFAGSHPLPSIHEMIEDIEAKKFAMKQRYFQSPKHTLQVDFVPYMDEIAQIIGCKPSLKQVITHSYLRTQLKIINYRLYSRISVSF